MQFGLVAYLFHELYIAYLQLIKLEISVPQADDKNWFVRLSIHK